ncbi:hypothetical protein RAN3_0437 [plant metagenome]|uniref:Uncharacterized protein n=1 Tax=plant metagenome TaxID=1297885 RepID=A0A484UPB5_9ZZZZ
MRTVRMAGQRVVVELHDGLPGLGERRVPVLEASVLPSSHEENGR